MHPLCHMDSDIADWLAIIHLESYQDTFKQNGYVLVRDVTSLCKEDLQKLGITATGHCKRILNLVQQTHLFEDNKSGHMAEDSHSTECTYFPDRPVIKNEEMLAKTISDSEVDHDLASQLQHSLLNKESTYPIGKPVPKPRTVFPRDHGTAKLQPVSLSMLLPVHKPIFSSTQGAHNIQERFDQEKCTTNAGTFDTTSKDGRVHTLASQREATEDNSGTGIQTFVHINEMSTEGKCLSKTLSFLSIPKISSLCNSQSMDISPTTSISTAKKIKAETVLVPSVLIRSASLENKKEMAPDVTFPLPAKSVEMKESLRGGTSIQHSEIVLQKGNFNTKKAGSLGQLCLCSQHSSEGPRSNSDAVDDFISPYCESLFGHCWPTQGQNSATSECQDYEDVRKYITNQSKDPIQAIMPPDLAMTAGLFYTGFQGFHPLQQGITLLPVTSGLSPFYRCPLQGPTLLLPASRYEKSSGKNGVPFICTIPPLRHLQNYFKNANKPGTWLAYKLKKEKEKKLVKDIDVVLPTSRVNAQGNVAESNE